MENSKVKKHVTIVGSIQIGFSVLGLMASVAIFVALSFARAMTENDEVAQTILRFLSISLPVTIGIFSTVGLVAGIGLLVHKPWARNLIIIISTLGCLNIPFGTIKGIYSIWVLLKDESIELFADR